MTRIQDKKATETLRGFRCQTDKDFKEANINMFKELQKTMFKKVKEGMVVSHQIENISEEIQIIKRVGGQFWS